MSLQGGQSPTRYSCKNKTLFILDCHTSACAYVRNDKVRVLCHYERVYERGNLVEIIHYKKALRLQPQAEFVFMLNRKRGQFERWRRKCFSKIF